MALAALWRRVAALRLPFPPMAYPTALSAPSVAPLWGTPLYIMSPPPSRNVSVRLGGGVYAGEDVCRYATDGSSRFM